MILTVGEVPFLAHTKKGSLGIFTGWLQVAAPGTPIWGFVSGDAPAIPPGKWRSQPIKIQAKTFQGLAIFWGSSVYSQHDKVQYTTPFPTIFSSGKNLVLWNLFGAKHPKFWGFNPTTHQLGEPELHGQKSYSRHPVVPPEVVPGSGVWMVQVCWGVQSYRLPKF